MDRKDFLSAFGGKRDHIPVWFMRQAGRYLPYYQEIRKEKTIKDICSDPSTISDISYSPVQQLGVDASIIFFDITLPLEAMGYSVEFKENVGPIISNSARDRHIHGYEEKSDKYSLLEGIRTFRRDHPNTFLYGFTGGPITLASYVIAGSSDRDLSQTISTILQNPGAYRDIMQELMEMIIETARLQVRSGADAIQIFDSWAGSMPYSLFEEYVNNYLLPLSAELSSIRTVYFSTRTSGYISMLSRTDFSYLSMDSRSRLSDISLVCHEEKGMQGNLDPLYTAFNINLAIKETKRILEDARNLDRYIFNLGHGVLPSTSVECLRNIVRTVHSYE
ncbi:MAG: uroporphyrinogen decarboxylase [Candidatus Thermoplasmatota archaeon]|nr:uroporphyrinogen decarboxylase [Candidatus Thermoplasmatota archaeon]